MMFANKLTIPSVLVLPDLLQPGSVLQGPEGRVGAGRDWDRAVVTVRGKRFLHTVARRGALRLAARQEALLPVQQLLRGDVHLLRLAVLHRHLPALGPAHALQPAS